MTCSGGGGRCGGSVGGQDGDGSRCSECHSVGYALLLAAWAVLARVAVAAEAGGGGPPLTAAAKRPADLQGVMRCM